MKKILILGGSHRDIPLIKASQELGYFVITLGDRDYYLGHEYSDKNYKINFNDLNKVREIIKKENIDYLIPGSGEASYLNTVKLAHELNIGNFDTLETAQLVHNKWKFKKFCLKHKISTPKGYIYTSEDTLQDLDFPVIVKPTNLSGGRGVSVVKSPKELETALKSAKEVSDEVFVEEFIEGELIAYSVFLQYQKIIYGFTGKDATYLNPYLVTTAYPISLDEKVLKKLKKDIENLSESLNLVDGMFHLQVIIKQKVPYIIDVTRRIPGDLYPDLIEYCDKIQYSKAVIKAYIGVPIEDEFIPKATKDFIIRHCVMPSANGIYKELTIDKKINTHIIHKLNLIPENTQIKDFLHTQLEIIFIKINKENLLMLNNLNTLVRPSIII
ncbi:ATP-grasp domain-containing protein [Sulfurimonas sp. MAG313]|nr:ATP-grasp domain-containing protein [Sulfurimonas sp. MAG313]MDF1882103.1 ATP-grasp domain-containing protein [Sulfurimonas sp. MAG313]